MIKEGLLAGYDWEFEVFVTELFGRFGYEMEKSGGAEGTGKADFMRAIKKTSPSRLLGLSEMPSNPGMDPDRITKKGNALGIKLFNRSMRMLDAEALEYADKATEHGCDWFFLVSVNGYMNSGARTDVNKNEIIPEGKKISVWDIRDVDGQAKLVNLEVDSDNYKISSFRDRLGHGSGHEMSNQPPKFELNPKWKIMRPASYKLP